MNTSARAAQGHYVVFVGAHGLLLPRDSKPSASLAG